MDDGGLDGAGRESLEVSDERGSAGGEDGRTGGGSRLRLAASHESGFHGDDAAEGISDSLVMGHAGASSAAARHTAEKTGEKRSVHSAPARNVAGAMRSADKRPIPQSRVGSRSCSSSDSDRRPPRQCNDLWL